MGSLILRSDIEQRMAGGKILSMQFRQTSSAATTAALATSGHHTVQIFSNTIGTTFMSTLVGIPPTNKPPGPTRLLHAMAVQNAPRTTYLARLYTIGTVALNATGNQLTHDAATFPVLRPRFGVANSAVPLVPMIFITTATTTTAAVIRLATAADGVGYVNQDGTSVRSVFNFTMPAGATALSSGFVFVLNSGDSAVRDISQVRVVTAAAAGAATVYGAELLAPVSTIVAGLTTTIDVLFGGLSMTDLTPATATAGTATSILTLISFGTSTASGTASGEILAVLDTN